VSGVGDIIPETTYGSVKTKEAVAAEVQSTEEVVREYFADIPDLIQVARCESTFRHYQADGSVLTGQVDSRDTGVMQINTHYHGQRLEQLGLDVFKLEDNLTYARRLYETEGLKPWSASRPCWGRVLAYNG